MRLFTSPRMTALLQRFRPPEGEPISAPVLNKSIETAQKRVEGRNYAARKHTLEYDDVMNKQRKEVYAFRNDLLWTDNPLQIAEEILETAVSQLGAPLAQARAHDKEALFEQFRQSLMTHFPVRFEPGDLEIGHAVADMESKAQEMVLSAFRQKLLYQRHLLFFLRPELNEPEKAQNILQEIVRNLMIRKIDQLWQEHLLAIDHLRSDVHMRTVGQKDPLLEFKHDAFMLFETFSLRLRQEIARDLFRFEMMPTQSHPSSLKAHPSKRTLIREQGS